MALDTSASRSSQTRQKRWPAYQHSRDHRCRWCSTPAVQRTEEAAGRFGCSPLMAKVYVCFMVGKTELSNVRAMLTGVRLQIELLQKAVEQNPHDKESRKRL